MKEEKLERDDWPEWKERRQDEKRFASQPLVMVTQKEAIRYCEKQHKRLPTVEEWQAAARGPWGWTYPWGESVAKVRELVKTSAYDERSNPATTLTHSLDHFKDDVSVFGVRDMAARVYEWTANKDGSLGAQGASVYIDVTHLGKSEEYIDLRSSTIDLGKVDGKAFRLSRWSRKESPRVFDRDLGFRCVKDRDP